MELGKKIKQLRFKAGLTQEQLAEKLGVVPQSVSKWETAVAMPDINNTNKFGGDIMLKFTPINAITMPTVT